MPPRVNWGPYPQSIPSTHRGDFRFWWSMTTTVGIVGCYKWKKSVLFCYHLGWKTLGEIRKNRLGFTPTTRKSTTLPSSQVQTTATAKESSWCKLRGMRTGKRKSLAMLISRPVRRIPSSSLDLYMDHMFCVFFCHNLSCVKFCYICSPWGRHLSEMIVKALYAFCGPRSSNTQRSLSGILQNYVKCWPFFNPMKILH